MKRFASLLFIGVCSLFLSGFASGTEAETKGNIPYHATGKARVYIYRTAAASATVQPTVRLDGVNVGTVQPKVALYLDTTPEDHVVTVSKEAAGTLKLKVENGGTRYVRLNVVDTRIVPELVDNAIGEKEIADCKLVAPQ